MQKGQVSWITGASSGIGEAVAKELALKNHRLILSARRLEELERVKRECVDAGASKGMIYLLPMDVTDYDSMEENISKAHKAFGQIDLLYNNAGISQRSLASETEMSTYRTLFEVDVFGQIALTKYVVEIMKKQGNGHIAVTSSVAGKVGVPYRTGYCAAKHAVMGFFDALRAELSNDNIQVSTVVPGFINTNIAKYAVKGDGSEFGANDGDIAGGMDVRKCAKVIVKGFSKGKKEIPVGKGMEMHALWIKRLWPSLIMKMIARKRLKKAK